MPLGLADALRRAGHVLDDVVGRDGRGDTSDVTASELDHLCGTLRNDFGVFEFNWAGRPQSAPEERMRRPVRLPVCSP